MTKRVRITRKDEGTKMGRMSGEIKKGRQIGETLDKVRDDHVHRYGWAASKILKSWPGATNPITVIDLGCGTGYGSYLMADQGLVVTAVDEDADIIKYGEQHYKHTNLTRKKADLKEGIPKSYLTSPTPNAATAFEFLEHVENAPEILVQLHEAGVKMLVGSVPNQLTVPFNKKLHKYHVRHYTPDEISAALRKAGWSNIYIGGQVGKRGDAAKIVDEARASRTICFIAIA